MNKARPAALPKARKDRLIIKELPDETLVYDLDSDLAHCLNTTANAVWKNCDGLQSITDIGKSLEKEMGTRVEEDVVWLALAQLEEHKLLAVGPAKSGIGRRKLLRNLGVTALALPAIVSIVVPTAHAQASCINPGKSPTGTACGSPNQCCSDHCCTPTSGCPNNTCR